MDELPVDSLLPELVDRLRTSPCIVLEAPPGSGKTTRVAPKLIEAGLCNPRSKTFLIQPRRVAARATAERIAAERNWKLGEEVGYQVRFDSRVSAKTSLVVATEGVLLRHLMVDATLDGVGTVILDEFHERSLNGDLLVSMLRQIQQLVREDLKIIVMSATLDTKPLEDFLDGSVLKSSGTLHPVDIKFRPPPPRSQMADHVADTILQTVERTDGDVLVFLPGVGEIKQVERTLQQSKLPRDCQVQTMHGSLPLEEQNRVVHASGTRRVVLSTNVAETSLTIEGIRTVIDSGQVRVQRYDPSVGLNRLQLEPVCQSSATQRAGRAGRLCAGLCIRLWDDKADRARPKYLDPEIRRVDLSGALLQLCQWGENPAEFPWFETPREDSIRTATNLLGQLGAIEGTRITPVGEAMCRIPAPPRLARMMIEAQNSGRCRQTLKAIALVAAMLSERDPFLKDRGRFGASNMPTTSDNRWACDITERLNALLEYYDIGRTRSKFGEIHRGAARTIRQAAEQFLQAMPDHPKSESEVTRDESNIDAESVLRRALLAAFPDRVAKRRAKGDSRGQMVGGRGVKLSPSSGIKDSDLFLCIDVDDKSRDALVRQACGLSEEDLSQEHIEQREDLFFNPSRKQVEARLRRRWFDLVISEKPTSIPDSVQCSEILFSEASKEVSKVAPKKDPSFEAYLLRVLCLAQWAPELDLPTDRDGLMSAILRELCVGKRSFAELQAAPWLDWLKGQLTLEQQQAIERECPERIEVPSGNRIKIEYTEGKPPVLAVRIQEVFTWTQTPRIAFNRVPLLLHLLAPNMRPQQVTDDLASFWANTYETVRKELKRRYSKHAWPEDPLTADPKQKRPKK
ncbi:MAG: ATP-dependent helicase HrpB [Planctomycetales bacterium]|nr:ATP-dependent helicase HrpB [Planctomycetales bacterium]